MKTNLHVVDSLNKHIDRQLSVISNEAGGNGQHFQHFVWMSIEDDDREIRMMEKIRWLTNRSSLQTTDFIFGLFISKEKYQNNPWLNEHMSTVYERADDGTVVKVLKNRHGTMGRL